MTGEWRRDTTPARICACGHAIVLHRTDTQTQKCDLNGCPCPGFDLTQLRWRETRFVTEDVA